VIVLRSILLRARRLLDRGRANREIADELQFHVHMSEQENIRAGLDPAEAGRRARLELGGLDRFAEEYRDVSGTRLLEDMAQDVRYAARSLRRTPVFTLCALLTLALGIGLATSMFSVADAVLLRPLPFADPDGLVRVWQNDRMSGTTREASAVPDYFDYVERTRAFSSIAAHYEQQRSHAAPDGAERVTVVAATHQLLPLLDVPLLLGRSYGAVDDVPGASPVAVLSESFWRSRFGADPGVIGSMLRLDDTSHRIIGVVRHGHEYPHRGVDAWVPLAMDASSVPRYTHILDVTARLAPDVPVAAAQRDMDRIMADLEREHPQTNDARGAFVEPVTDVILGSARTPLLILIVGVTLLLVTACANVASLLLARAAGRSGELAVRTALGAARNRLVRQLVVESLTLTITAGALGAAAAWVALRVFVARLSHTVPRIDEASFDLRVFGFALIVCVITGVLFGVAPTSGTRRDHASALRLDGARGGGMPRAGLRRTLVTAQIALSVMLLAIAGLLLRSFVSVSRVDPGFDAAGVVKVEYQLPESRYPRSFDNYPAWPEVQRFLREAHDAVRSLPGVSSAALAAQHPLAAGFTNSFVIIGREGEAATQPEIAVRAVTPDYAHTMGLELVGGRMIDDRDHADAPAVILINRAAAARFFPGSDPLGHRIRYWGAEREIVGVVGDERFQGIVRDAPPAAYSPLAQTPMHGGVLLIRTTRDADALASEVRRAIRRVDPQLALFGIEPLTRTMSDAIARERLTALLLGIFAVAALVLTSVGVHGLITYLFVQRSRELGIRAALGARPGQLRGLFMREGMVLAVTGITAGLAAAALVGGALDTLLFRTSARDPLTFTLVAFVMIAVTATSCWLPARRAGSASPLVTMRR
jgi:putative ABC transport system permease protein